MMVTSAMVNLIKLRNRSKRNLRIPQRKPLEMRNLTVVPMNSLMLRRLHRPKQLKKRKRLKLRKRKHNSLRWKPRRKLLKKLRMLLTKPSSRKKKL